MCYFCVTYEDGRYFECSHITSVTYTGSDGLITIPENELTEHCFPFKKTLWLHSNQGTYSVCGTGIRAIECRKE
jgi:hypothetical protein